MIFTKQLHRTPLLISCWLTVIHVTTPGVKESHSKYPCAMLKLRQVYLLQKKEWGRSSHLGHLGESGGEVTVSTDQGGLVGQWDFS